MIITKINLQQNKNNIAFGNLKIDPDSNVILKPIRRQLNTLAKDCDVTIKKFEKECGDYKDFGIIIDVAKEDLKSKNIIRNFVNRLTGANLPAASRRVARKCVMNDNGSKETLFEAEHDLIRSRILKSVKDAIEEHNVIQYPKMDKYKPFFDKILVLLSK